MYEIREIQNRARNKIAGSVESGELRCEFEFTQLGGGYRLPKLSFIVGYRRNRFNPTPWTVLIKPEGRKYLFRGDVEGMTEANTVEDVLDVVYALTGGFMNEHDSVKHLPSWMRGDADYQIPPSKNHSPSSFDPELDHEIKREKERERNRPARRPF